VINENTLKLRVEQLWQALLNELSRDHNQKFDRRDLACFAGILLSLAAGLVASWQRWGNPLVDSGRELNVPLKLLHGERLYSEVGYIYGPFSPYVNASLYRLFHPSMWILWGHGIVSTVTILGMAYWIARQITGRFPATLACVAITWVCALKSQGNYMMAYAFGGLDGCTFVLATTILLIVFFRKKSRSLILCAGIAAALAVLSKTEFGGAAIGTGMITALLAGYPRTRNVIIWLGLFLTPAVGLPALVFSLFAARIGWSTLTQDSHLFFGHVPWQLMYFNGQRFGFSHPWHSLGLMIASLVRLIAFGGLVVSVSYLIEMRKADFSRRNGGMALKRSWVVATFLISLMGLVVSGIGLSDLGPFMPMPFLLLVPVAGGVAAFVRAQRDGLEAAQIQAATMVIIAASALGSLARIILRVSTGGALSSFLLPGSVILFVYIWVQVFPLMLAEPAVRRRARQLVYAALVAGVLLTAVTISVRYQRKFSYPFMTARGTWRTSPDLGVAFTQAYQFVQEKTVPGDFLAVLPEGTSLVFLSDRRNPLREEIVTPGFLDATGEARAIDALRSSHTPMIFIANRVTPEFSETLFGRDYNQRLMFWIEQNYAVCGVFGIRPDASLQIGAPVFFLRAYCLAPTISEKADPGRMRNLFSR
jgi:hypothetical protein